MKTYKSVIEKEFSMQIKSFTFLECLYTYRITSIQPEFLRGHTTKASTLCVTAFFMVYMLKQNPKDYLPTVGVPEGRITTKASRYALLLFLWLT